MSSSALPQVAWCCLYILLSSDVPHSFPLWSPMTSHTNQSHISIIFHAPPTFAAWIRSSSHPQRFKCLRPPGKLPTSLGHGRNIFPTWTPRNSHFTLCSCVWPAKTASGLCSTQISRCCAFYVHLYMYVTNYNTHTHYIYIYIHIKNASTHVFAIISKYPYNSICIYTLRVQCWCLPTHFTNVEVYLRICVMSMFTHQCRCLPLRHEVQQIYQPFVLLPDLYLGHASLVKLMRYHFESHLTQNFP